MSESTTHAASVNPTPATLAADQQHELLMAAPLYATATPELQALVRQDMAVACGEGCSPEDYLEGVQTWPDTLADMLGEGGITVPAPAIPAAEQHHDTPAPQAAVQESADKAALAAATAESEQRELVDKLRVAASKAFRKGEAAYAVGLLECGRLCGEYVGGRLALGDKREVAVKALEGELSKWASEAVDVNRLVRTYHAYRLLAVEQDQCGKAGHSPVPYGQLRDSWVRLVERAKGEKAECYVLLPGVEAACRAMFRRVVRDELSSKAAAELVGKLVRASVARSAKAEQAKAQQAKAQHAAEQGNAKAAADELAKAQAAERAAQEAHKAQASAESAAAVKASQEALEASQRAAVAAQAKAEQAARDKAAAEKREAAEKTRLAKEATKAAAKATKAATPAPATLAAGPTPTAAPAGGKDNPADQRGTVTGNLMSASKAGTPKDVAALLGGAIMANADPAALLYELAKGLVWGRKLAAELVRGMADNEVDPAKAESAMTAMQATLEEYGLEAEEEEEAKPAAKSLSPVAVAKAMLGATPGSDAARAVSQAAGLTPARLA